MKTILFSTTNSWNCGDDFIRLGVENLLNLKSNVRILWWNRSYNVLNKFENSLKINLPLIDYFIIAGTPQYAGRNESIFTYCLRNKIPIAFIGIGTNNIISKWHWKLFSTIAQSNLCEIVLTRDNAATLIMKTLGFENVVQIPDPAFFIKCDALNKASFHQRNLNILCWRNFDNEILTTPSKMPLIKNKPLLYLRLKFNIEIRRNFKKYLKKKSLYLKNYELNSFFIRLFQSLKEPKIVIIHSNREIHEAEKLFGKKYVYYSSNYLDMLKIYSKAKTYIGTRIHGAIPSIVNGASVILIYESQKCSVLKEGIEILSKNYPELKNSIRIIFTNEILSNKMNMRIAPPDNLKLQQVIYEKYLEIHDMLKNLKILSSFIKKRGN